MAEITAIKVQSVIDGIITGKTLKNAMEDEGVSPPLFFRYLKEHPSAEEAYNLAQQARSEIIVDEILEIADTEADPQRARVRVEARKWYASKMIPKKYGDRIDLNVSGTVDINAALLEAKQRVLPASYQVIDEDAEAIEHTKQIEDSTTDNGSVAKDAEEKSLSENEELEK